VDDNSHFCFAYEASQGEFEMAIPKSVCEVIQYDSTVECLAQHILDELQTMAPSKFMVRAFEGVGKGAMIGNE
jgi:hypothetical protein